MATTALPRARCITAHVPPARERDDLATWFCPHMGIEAGTNDGNTVQAEPRDLRALLVLFREATGSVEVDLWTRSRTAGFVKYRRQGIRSPIKEQFDKTRLRPREEMKTEIDQAHFLIGAARPGGGMNIEGELSENTWAVYRSVEAVLQCYAKTAVEPEIKDAAELAATLLRTSLEQRRSLLVHEQGSCSTTSKR